MGKGKAFIFSAPSGSGKTTIVQHLINHRNDLVFSVSATTRAPRGQEKNGKDYHFLSLEIFHEKVKRGLMVEWQEVYPGIFYGTLWEEVYKIWSNGQHVVFDVDVLGGINLKKEFKEQALSVFIQVSNIEILRERLFHRATDDTNIIEMRFQKAIEEVKYAPYFDMILENNDLLKACKSAEELVSNFLEK